MTCSSRSIGTRFVAFASPVRLKPRIFENSVSNEMGFFVFPPPSPVIVRYEAIKLMEWEVVKLLMENSISAHSLIR
jgi:hypothetical protein